MTRINTNVPSLIAQNRLSQSNNDLQTALTRLSTGLRINSGKDDPAGLIASEALRSDITGLNKAISNTQRASQIIATADSALSQVSSLLNDIRGLVVEAANNGALSDDEIAANQLQVDSSLEAINRIAQTTTFQGRKLLDGSLDFITRGGAGFNTVADLKIDQANLGATGQVNVDVQISAAATRATLATTGIPASTTGANSTVDISFGDPTPGAEASGTVNLANSYTIGAEASGDILFANATTPDGEASGTVTLGDSGISFDIEAVDGSAVDGTRGNGVIINVTTVANGTASSGSYDANTNTLNLIIEEGETAANIVTDLAADVDVAALFTIDNGVGAGPTTSADAGVYTGELSGGSDATNAATGFTLAARNGGAVDGALGNATDVRFTSGASNSAVYNAETNELLVTVEAGATIADIAATINADVGDDFIASNTVNGSYSFQVADATLRSNPMSNGTNVTAASSFTLEAVNGQGADGTVGNSTTLAFTSGATTEAVYDADANVLNITVAAGALVNDVVQAINDEGTFIASNPLNGTALFGAADLTTIDPNLTGGADDEVEDIITVTADDQTDATNGVTVSFVEDNSYAVGAVTARVNDDGNIVVTTRNSGSVALSNIAAAIDALEGFSASITTNDGDGQYNLDTDTAPATATLADGVFGGGLADDIVFQLTGATGSETFQFDRGATLDSIVQSINLVSDATSIVASNDAGALRLTSTVYGSKGVVAVEVTSEGADGQFEDQLTTKRASGTDIVATVNGYTASGDGNTLSINTASLDLSMTVAEGSSTSINFDITGGGAMFQLGPDVVSNQQARMGIGSLNTSKLGGASGRLYELGSGQSKSLTSDISGAARVVDEVINKVTNLRGRLGAFQATTLDSNLVSLNDTMANLQQAESSIRDADFAAESAKLTRAQILVQSGTNVLALANQNPQNVLSLLR